MFSGRKIRIIAAIIVVLVWWFFLRPAKEVSKSGDGEVAKQQAVEQIWTCSMHPQIRQPKAGQCPICGMNLIPVIAEEGGSAASNQISFSEEAKKLMEIETSVVERKFVPAEIRLVGKAEYDESRVKYITAWVPGRIDRLYVDYTGVMVNKGDHLVYFYSPELLATQTELIQASKSAAGLKAGSSEFVSRSIVGTLEAAREKLRLLGLTKEQIEEIEKSAEPSDHIIIYAPIGGIVIQKDATEGMYVETGMKIYTIADLSRVWVKLDAYESDLMWVRYGQKAEFTTEAYPGEVFAGRISFISPTLDETTRTIKLRVDVNNIGLKLKPGMFVHATIRSQVAAGGLVMDAQMKGKWICPMHPDVVKESAGECDICGMPLVTTESLGYAVADTSREAPLVIPASAALVTGKRAIVYVQIQGAAKPTYEGREIMLGPKAGDYYIVDAGLMEGEAVVTKGSFKIDSAMQIQAKPSMMNPEGGEMPAGEHIHSH